MQLAGPGGLDRTTFNPLVQGSTPRRPTRWSSRFSGGLVRVWALVIFAPGLTFFGKRPRQPEPWHHARGEAGDRGDAVVGDRDDMQSVGPEDTSVRVAYIHAERWLAVGAGRYHSEGPTGPEDDCCEEPTGHVHSPVLQHRGRHGDPDVLGEQPYQGLEVGSFQGVGQLGDEPVLGCGVRLARGPAAA